MSDLKKAKIVFENWNALFPTMGKTKEYYYDNFHNLFVEMKRISVPFDIAYEFINDAVIRHTPSTSTVKHIYKKSPNLHRRCTEQEFSEEWKGLIKNRAYEAFHDLYPIGEKEKLETSKVELPKSMSRDEYRLQRRHAESFPIIDLSKIEEPYKSTEDLDFSLEDLEK